MGRHTAISRDVTSKSIDGISDLVVWAPIKEGFIDAFVNVTYETRLRLVAEALHNVRRSSREFEILEPYADTAKRILTLLDFRIGIVDREIHAAHKLKSSGEEVIRPRKFMYLVATFDGPWEPYIRLIWQPLGSFLDLVLCNCEGYTSALDSDFETYSSWVRNNQLDSAIFYSTSGQTVVDTIYLPEIEKLARTFPPSESEQKIAAHAIRTPEAAARQVQTEHPKASLGLGMEALNVLYKLTDFYPPISRNNSVSDEGRYLLSATRELLAGFDPRKIPEKLRLIYKDQIDWFLTPVTGLEDTQRDPPFSHAEIQKGVLSSYDEADKVITHGALLLCRIDNAQDFRKFLKLIKWSWEDGSRAGIGEVPFGAGVFLNIAFSYRGLERIGVPQARLLEFPKEFRDGMKDRAPQIGDKFESHPRRWHLPKRNWPRQSDKKRQPIEMSEIDVVLQVRASLLSPRDPQNAFYPFSERASDNAELFDAAIAQFTSSLFSLNAASAGSADAEKASAPFSDGLLPWLLEQAPADKNGEPLTLLDGFLNVIALLGKDFGFTMLGVEDMFRPDVTSNERDGKTSITGAPTTTDHFGFRDGISQPTLVPSPEEIRLPTDVLMGDLVYGYANTRQDFHIPQKLDSLVHNGTFMVVRKIAQDRTALERLKADHGEDMVQRMVGRKQNGASLVRGSVDNEFTFQNDPGGIQCPLNAHIRLANPRSGASHGREVAKLARRGMSYGPSFSEDPDKERGIVFMAYCSSIAEQYEIIQRWLNVGNPTLVSSAQNDPLTGAMPRDKVRTFRYFDTNGTVQRARIPSGVTQLQWGEYFFLPSRSALDRLTQDPPDKASERIERGRKAVALIETQAPLVQQEEWKRILEDYLTREPTRHNVTPDVWEAIQAAGGAFKIPHGVAFDHGDPRNEQPVILVTDGNQISTIFRNAPAAAGAQCPYSTREQLRRCSAPDSFGAIYVATDEDVLPYPNNSGNYGSYQEEAYPANTILMSHSRERAFTAGYAAGRERLNILDALRTDNSVKFDLAGFYIQPALGFLCRTWFGIPDGEFFAHGSWNWNLDGKPSCPGSFLAPSRHAFYPRPTASIDWIGKKHGHALREAVRGYLAKHWDAPDGIPGEVTRPMHIDIRNQAANAPHRQDYLMDLLGRNIIGIMVGALPPMEANLRSVFFEGIEEGTLWHWQDSYRRAQGEGTPWHAAQFALEAPLKRAMSIRPAPDLLYRTVKVPEVKIGNVTAYEGDLVILCLSAATQEALRQGSPDVSLVFGGDRRATSSASGISSLQHACPAQDMAMGGMMGILAALMDAGRIQSLPASLIIQLSD